MDKKVKISHGKNDSVPKSKRCVQPCMSLQVVLSENINGGMLARKPEMSTDEFTY